jgi:hypothetical protein
MIGTVPISSAPRIEKNHENIEKENQEGPRISHALLAPHEEKSALKLKRKPQPV